MAIRYFARPECGQEDRVGPTFGPFDEFLQLTYEDLRVGPDGKEIAQLGTDGYWHMRPEFCDPDIAWSDIVVWAEDVP